ncbi:hypothetical protein [Brevibacillus sp. SYSU BS000544]|uniref:hypothetical protein n=1 Tax=Brevibacillus sp. SYSU BS000544 TaxID=3416443 RepID=UPI003CE4EC78
MKNMTITDENVIASCIEGYRNGSVTNASNRLYHGLSELRKSMSPDQWKETCKQLRSEAIAEFVYQDPFTKRAYDKPRGYAGDAVMMDFIYSGNQSVPTPVTGEETSLGLSILQELVEWDASKAVRERKEVIARKIDELANVKSLPSVLAVASGHLREAGISHAVQSGKIGHFHALDQDHESLAVIESEYRKYGIDTIPMSILEIVKGKCKLPTYDLIYSAGLYDYLEGRMAERLTRNLFNQVKPGGKLIIANFLPDFTSRGYMEVFMDWWLCYRNEIDMINLIREIPSASMSKITIFPEPNKTIVFIEIDKV